MIVIEGITGRRPGRQECLKISETSIMIKCHPIVKKNHSSLAENLEDVIRLLSRSKFESFKHWQTTLDWNTGLLVIFHWDIKKTQSNWKFALVIPPRGWRKGNPWRDVGYSPSPKAGFFYFFWRYVLPDLLIKRFHHSIGQASFPRALFSGLARWSSWSRIVILSRPIVGQISWMGEGGGGQRFDSLCTTQALEHPPPS